MLLNSRLVQQQPNARSKTSRPPGRKGQNAANSAPSISSSIFARCNLLSETDPLQYSDYEDELAPFRTVEDDLNNHDHPTSDLNLLQLIDVK